MRDAEAGTSLLVPTDDAVDELRALGFSLVAGVDEVGRGALAGPVVAAACILPESHAIAGVRDSKLVPEEEREELYDRIVEAATAWGVGAVSEHEIDRINILQATFVAMRLAISRLSVRPEYVLIDGRDAVDVGIPCRAIIGGDGLCTSIAAASILAKVTRDRIMRGLHFRLPHYGFLTNKGYATPEHRRALAEHGPAAVHRVSFLGRILQQEICFEEERLFSSQHSEGP